MFIAGRRNRTRGILVSGFRTKLNAESQPEESVPLFLKVECYAGYKPDERPLRFSFISTGDSGSESSAVRGKPTYQVAEVIDRWYGPDYECFRIRADDHNLYVLRHHLGEDSWSLDSYRRDDPASQPNPFLENSSRRALRIERLS